MLRRIISLTAVVTLALSVATTRPAAAQALMAELTGDEAHEMNHFLLDNAPPVPFGYQAIEQVTTDNERADGWKAAETHLEAARRWNEWGETAVEGVTKAIYEAFGDEDSREE